MGACSNAAARAIPTLASRKSEHSRKLPRQFVAEPAASARCMVQVAAVAANIVGSGCLPACL
jgi:hypothetical protein